MAQVSASMVPQTPQAMAAHLSTGRVGASRVLKEYVDRIDAARKVSVSQGNLEIVTATVGFTTDGGGAIAAGTQATAFVDLIGQNANSGIAPLTQTFADGNLFGGQIPSGELHVYFGLQLNVECENASFPANDVEILSRNVSVEMQLRRTPVRMGSVRDWPSVQGPRGSGNGNVTQGVRPFAPPVVMRPLMNFSIIFTVERAITLSNATQLYYVHVDLPNLRIYDPLVLGKS